MIRVLIKPAVILTCLWIVLILGFDFLGNFKTKPMMGLFTNPDGTRCQMPCLFGMQPGITTMQDAKWLIQNHPFTHNLRLMDNDLTGTPGGHFGGSAVHNEKSSLIFMGQEGQVVVLQIYYRQTQDSALTNEYNPLRVYQACLTSLFNDATTYLPKIDARLSRMWHTTSFNQMLATLGPPLSISHPSVLPTYAWLSSTRMESFYFEDHLSIVHSSDNHLPPDFERNFFGGICIHSRTDYRIGFHGRVGGILPWLGLYATVQQYQDWVAHNPVVFP